MASAAAVAALACVATPAGATEDYFQPYWTAPAEMIAWRGSLSLGGTYARSRAESYNLSLQGDLDRITGSDRWTSHLWMIFGRSDGNENAALFDVRSRYSRDIRKRWFGFVQGDYRRDRPGNLERRTSLGAGVGYRIAERRYLSWYVLAGLGYTAESFYTPLDIIDGPRTRYDRGEALLGTEAEFELTENLTLTQRFTWYPNLSYSSAHRLVYDATARAAITERLSMDVTVSWRKSTEPGVDKRPDELLVVTGLALRLD
ncbi:MAG: DUF481 domain-containing protein [Gemmatimonadales bacterium]|nr:DUF481 domain-containing protein [Gemmatimonadales bacterium]